MAAPQRKDKQMLTLIPEQERSIDYRFEFTIVGEGARSFAEMAVHSEMAEAFRPTAKAKEEAPMENAPTEDDGKKREGENKEKLILFCPIGEGSKALARVRFTCVEQFSDSLPLTKDAQASMNQAIVFIFNTAAHAADKRAAGKGPPLDEFRSDFISRFAEINHHPEQYRPFSRILAIEAEPDALDTLNEVGKSKNVGVDSAADGSEEGVIEAVQELCEALIKRASEKGTQSQPAGSSPRDAGAGNGAGSEKKSRGCVLL